MSGEPLFVSQASEAGTTHIKPCDSQLGPSSSPRTAFSLPSEISQPTSSLAIMSGFIRFDAAQNESLASIAASSSTTFRPIAIASDEKRKPWCSILAAAADRAQSCLLGRRLREQRYPDTSRLRTACPAAAVLATGAKKKFSPVPLGLFSIASTTLLLSLINVQVRGLTQPCVFARPSQQEVHRSHASQEHPSSGRTLLLAVSLPSPPV